MKDKYESLFCGEVSNLTTTGQNNERLQFQLRWPVERVYDEIQSTIKVDSRGRVTNCSLRPGPLKMENWDDKDAKQLLEDAVTAVDGQKSVEIEVSGGRSGKWRTHVEINDKEHIQQIAMWTAKFQNEYRNLRTNRLDDDPEYSYLVCFNCESRPISRLCRARVVEDEEITIGVCASCTESVLNLPFVLPYMQRDTSESVVELYTGNKTITIPGIQPRTEAV